MKMGRPIGKELLKKMILKVMAKDQPSVSVEWILKKTLPEFFEIDPLSKDEYGDAFRGSYELERDGYIMQDPDQTHQRTLMLTTQGRKVVAESLDKMQLPSLNIDQLISRDDLRSLVRDDYNSGDYETAIFKAFRHLEESVRKKAGQPASAIGMALMSTVFKVSGGILKHPEAAVDSEGEAIHLLMRGAIGWFKNPSSHRTVGYDDSHQASHVLGFANLLLDLLDECK